jgi:hypothetical protein
MRYVIEAHRRNLPWIHYVRLFGLTSNAAKAETYPTLAMAKEAIAEWRKSESAHDYRFTLTRLRPGLSVANAVLCSEEVDEEWGAV